MRPGVRTALKIAGYFMGGVLVLLLGHCAWDEKQPATQ
jgi:hypothetical protein